VDMDGSGSGFQGRDGIHMYSFAFGVWEMDSRSGQGVWREGYERSFTAMDLCIMNANELASAAVTSSDS
jgi:hypothetical protein